MSKNTEKTITITPYGGKPYVLRVGDKVITRSRSRSRVPDSLYVHTVAKICGGSVLQWLELENGQERDTDGDVRGRSRYSSYESMEPFDQSKLDDCAAQWLLYNAHQKAEEDAHNAFLKLPLRDLTTDQLARLTSFLLALNAEPRS